MRAPSSTASVPDPTPLFLCIAATMAWVVWSGDTGSAAPWLLGILLLPLIGAAVWLTSIRPGVAIATVIASAAMSRFYVQIGGLKARPEHIAIGLLCLSAPLLRKRNQEPITWILSDYLLGAYIVANLVSSLFMSVAPAQTLKWATQQTLVILTYFLLRIIAGQPERFKRAVRILAAIGAIEAAYAIVCFFSNLLFNTEFGVEVGQYGTFPGTYGTTYEANILGAYSAASFMLILTLYFKEKRRIYLLGSVLTYGGLLISLSRAAILASLFALGLLIFVGLRTGLITLRTIRTVTTAIVIVSLVLAPAVIPLYIERFSTVEVADVTADPDTALRVVSVAMAADDIVQHPLFGNGTSSFQLLVSNRELGFGADVDETGSWIGNNEMRIIHDTGLIGFGIFLSFLASLAWKSWKLLHLQDNIELLALLLSGVVYCITFQATEGTLLAFSWVHLGLIGCAISIYKGQGTTKPVLPKRIGFP